MYVCIQNISIKQQESRIPVKWQDLAQPLAETELRNVSYMADISVQKYRKVKSVEDHAVC